MRVQVVGTQTGVVFLQRFGIQPVDGLALLPAQAAGGKRGQRCSPHCLLEFMFELGFFLLGIIQGLANPLQIAKCLAKARVLAEVEGLTIITGKQRPQGLIR